MNKFETSLLKVLCISGLVLLSSCSKDSAEEEPNALPENCEIENTDQGCEYVVLDATVGWVKILKQGSLADPLFLYLPANKSEPYGTVTISLENGFPTIKINDAILSDYLVTISQNSDGSNPICQTGKDIESINTGIDSPSTVKINTKYEFPFYIKLEANVCF